MKKNVLKVFVSALMVMAAVVNTGCSNEAGLASDVQQEQASTEGTELSFNFDLAGYGKEQSVATRGIAEEAKGRVIASSVSSLGDGLEAYTEVVEDAKPQTRATYTPAPAQNYTILAYKDGQKKGEWVGSYDGSKFTPKAGTSSVQVLQPGTYTFFVFSDHLTYKDGKIIIDINKGSVNALFNNQNVTILAQKKQKVDFHLVSPYARVRMKINGFSSQAFEGSINGALTYQAAAPTDAGGVKETCTIDPSVPSAVYANVTQAGQLKYQHFTNNIEGPQENGVVKTSYIITPEDAGVYFLAQTRLNKLSFQFASEASGTIYKKPVANKVLPLNLSDVELKIGTSYTISQTIYYSADYLFNDGTVGTLVPNLKAGRTPVALVVDKSRKVAMALKDVNGLKKWSTNWNLGSETAYPQTPAGLQAAIDKYDGYQETWDPYYTRKAAGHLMVSKRIKAGWPEFQAFTAVANFDPVPNKKWHVPGAGEWSLALKKFGIADPTSGFGNTQLDLPWGGDLGYRLQEILFYQAKGTPLNDWYWCANELSSDNRHKALTVTANTSIAHFGAAGKSSSTLVRPFINY